MGSQYRSVGLALGVMLLASCAGSSIENKAAGLPEVANEPEAQEAADAGNIVVTGSRIRSPNLESAMPVSVISSAEIADPFATFLSRLQGSLGGRDRRAVLQMVDLPLLVHHDDVWKTFRTRKDVERNYDHIFTPRVISSVSGTDADQLQSRDGGRLKGNGRIWFGCGRPTCASADAIRIRQVSP